MIVLQLSYTSVWLNFQGFVNKMKFFVHTMVKKFIFTIYVMVNNYD